MKAQLLAVLSRSPAALVAVLACLLLALWLVISNSYALSVFSGGTGLELKPSAGRP